MPMPRLNLPSIAPGTALQTEHCGRHVGRSRPRVSTDPTTPSAAPLLQKRKRTTTTTIRGKPKNNGRPCCINRRETANQRGDQEMNSTIAHERRLASLDTPSDLKPNAVKDLSATLTTLLSDMFA